MSRDIEIMAVAQTFQMLLCCDCDYATQGLRSETEFSGFTHLFALIFLLKETSRKGALEQKANIISRRKLNLLGRW